MQVKELTLLKKQVRHKLDFSSRFPVKLSIQHFIVSPERLHPAYGILICHLISLSSFQGQYWFSSASFEPHFLDHCMNLDYSCQKDL